MLDILLFLIFFKLSDIKKDYLTRSITTQVNMYLKSFCYIPQLIANNYIKHNLFN